MTKFVDKNYPETEKFKGFMYIESDPTIKTTFIKRKDVQNEFTQMLFDAYKSPVSYPSSLLDEMKDIEDEY